MNIENLKEKGRQLQLAELKKEIEKAIKDNNWLRFEVLTKTYEQVKNT